MILNGFAYIGWQRAGVADTRGATVADNVEAQLDRDTLSARPCHSNPRRRVNPGARELFTHGGTFNPFSTAFFASNPAASITEGFEVFVQLVIAAITIEPWSRYLFTSTPKRS